MDAPDQTSPADLGLEPEGHWDAANADVASWVTKYTEGQEDDGDPD
jgi:hypothetical protein